MKPWSGKARTLLVVLSLLIASFFAAEAGLCAAPPPRALILDDPTLPGYDAGLGDALRHTLTAAGYRADLGDADALAAPGALGADRCDLLVLTQASRLPTPLIPAFTQYVLRGGDLIVLGAPGWRMPGTVKRDGHWRTAAEDAAAQALVPAATPFLDFRPDFPVAALIRETNADQTPTVAELSPSGGGPGQVAGALHVAIPGLTGWDMWRTPDLSASPFAPGQTVTALSARGGPRTSRLAVEWDDRDGSRWIAVVPLTGKWRRYSLVPSDFHAWGVSSPEREKAGFNPSDAIRFKAGLAFTHTGQTGGPQEYWLGGVGTGKTPADSPAPLSAPILDTVAPAYKFSPIHGPVRLTTPPGTALTGLQVWASVDPQTWDVESSPPRATGAGFDKGRGWRWEPLLVARDAGTGQWRGVPAALYVHKPDGGGAGGVWASFAVGGAPFYREAGTQAMIADIARRMCAGLFLLDGGASAYTLLPGQGVRLGATIANMGATRQAVGVRVTVTDGAAPPLWQHTWQLQADAKASLATPAAEWTPPAGALPPDGCAVTAELLSGGVVVDRVRHRLFGWKPSAAPQYVTVGPDGHFHLGGRLWRACGVNYAPSSGIAQEVDDLYQRWLDPAAYDPESVERDLYHIQNLGFNAVSAWVYPGEGTWQDLLDFLRRCREHSLKVSLMLAPDVSAVAKADALRPLIERFLLPRNDTVFAYEIAWEPEFNGHDARRGMDDAWQKWVVARYGSVGAAEGVWKARIARDGSGAVTSPSDADLARPDGPNAAVAVAYRRFLDDWLAGRYAPIASRLHEIDPHHSVSFRMSHAGDPTDRGGMPYAFEGASRAVDYLAPEAYGRVGGWEQVRPGWFTAAYARAVAPGKPVVWAEVGASVWDDAAVGPAPDKLAFQGRFYDDFFRMATASGADGLFFWWYAGGYRYGEGSDYGLINPDGTDRPASLAVRRDAAPLLSAPPPAPPDVWLGFDRDAHPDGLVGVYDGLGAAFWEAVAQGRHPGLRSIARPAAGP